MDYLEVLTFLAYLPWLTTGDYCSQPPVNHIFSSSREDFYCPAYRNLVRHVPLEEGLCPTNSIYRKYKNCLSDHDCPKDSYCCFSICNGITRCYNPYTNEWADTVPEPLRKPPCPLIQVPAPNTPGPESPENVTEVPVERTPGPGSPEKVTALPKGPEKVIESSNTTPPSEGSASTTPEEMEQVPDPIRTTVRPKALPVPTPPVVTTKAPDSVEDVYDQISKSQIGDDDTKFIAEEAV